MAKNSEAFQGSSDRTFGFVVGTALFLLADYHYFKGLQISVLVLIAFACAVILWVFAIFRPGSLHGLNRTWMKLGLVLNKLTNPLIMGLLFFLVITPVGLIMRAFGKDILNLKIKSKESTYWIQRVPTGPSRDTMTNQF